MSNIPHIAHEQFQNWAVTFVRWFKSFIFTLLKMSQNKREFFTIFSRFRTNWPGGYCLNSDQLFPNWRTTCRRFCYCTQLDGAPVYSQQVGNQRTPIVHQSERFPVPHSRGFVPSSELGKVSCHEYANGTWPLWRQTAEATTRWRRYGRHCLKYHRAWSERSMLPHSSISD